MPGSITVSESGEVTFSCYAGINNDLIEFTIPINKTIIS